MRYKYIHIFTLLQPITTIKVNQLIGNLVEIQKTLVSWKSSRENIISHIFCDIFLNTNQRKLPKL